MRLIERIKYLNELISVIGTPDIKVITGIRRCGKSKLLESFKNYISKNIKNCNIIHINYNMPKYDNIKDYASKLNDDGFLSQLGQKIKGFIKKIVDFFK